MKKQLFIFVICVLTSLVTKAYDFKTDGVYYMIVNMSKNTVCVTSGENSYSGNITIPETVSYQNRTFRIIGIADAAFKNSNITSISLPNSMRLICSEAFRNCSNLKSVDFPDSLVYIGTAAFRQSGLEALVLPDNVRVVDVAAFADCSSLRTVVLGPLVGGGFATRIYIPEFGKKCYGELLSSVFVNCKNVEKLTIKDSTSQLETDIDVQADSHRIGGGVPFIYHFVNLKTLYVGRYLEGPDGRANLYHLTNLEHLELSKYARIEPVKSDLKTLKVHRKMPKKVDRTDYFTTKTKMNAILYVPKGSAKYYREAYMWKDFWNIVEMDN